jgi:hypothetical protein
MAAATRGKHQGSNAASRWGPSDLTTLIHDRHKIQSGCRTVRGDRMIKKIRLERLISDEQRASDDHDHERTTSDRCPQQLPSAVTFRLEDHESPDYQGFL